MPEPGEVRDGLVWTGSEWVRLKQGTTPEASEQPHSESESSGKPSAVVCPKCHQSDRLIRVSGLLDKSKTSETSYTFGTGIGVGTGGIGIGIGDAMTDTQGTNALAQRFGLHRPTVYGGCWITAIAVVLLALVGGVLATLGIGGGALSSALVVIVIAIAGFWYWKYLQFEKTWKVLYDESINRIRRAYYCERCDQAFDEVNQKPLDPEDFVKEIFSNYSDQFALAVSKVPMLEKIPRIKKLLQGENPEGRGELFDFR